MSVYPLGTLVVLVAVCSRLLGSEPPANEEGVAIVGGLAEVLGKIGHEVNRPVGLVWDGRRLVGCEADIVFRGGDLYGALDNVARRCPDYTWSRDGLSVFMLPRWRVKSFLDVRVAAYAVRGATRSEAAEAVVNLPEVKAWLKANRISTEQVYYISGIDPVVTHDLSIQLRGVQVHDVLDALARALGTMTWEIIWHGDSAVGVYPW